jgi:sugar lactone lactonase YvrE
VIPEDIDLVIDGKPVEVKQADGTTIRPRVGVNPIALDDSDEWLYYGAMHAKTLYRVRTRDLRDADLAPDVLAGRVQPYAQRPITDGISLDEAGNIYLGDLANNAIGVIDSGRNYRIVQRSPLMSWIDAFSFGPDGYFYVVANQLHRSAFLNGGVAATKPPFVLLRFRPYMRGRVGR